MGFTVICLMLPARLASCFMLLLYAKLHCFVFRLQSCVLYATIHYFVVFCMPIFAIASLSQDIALLLLHGLSRC